MASAGVNLAGIQVSVCHSAHRSDLLSTLSYPCFSVTPFPDLSLQAWYSMKHPVTPWSR